MKFDLLAIYECKGNLLWVEKNIHLKCLSFFRFLHFIYGKEDIKAGKSSNWRPVYLIIFYDPIPIKNISKMLWWKMKFCSTVDPLKVMNTLGSLWCYRIWRYLMHFTVITELSKLLSIGMWKITLPTRLRRKKYF